LEVGARANAGNKEANEEQEEENGLAVGKENEI
jgi:hypothetical protein